MPCMHGRSYADARLSSVRACVRLGSSAAHAVQVALEAGRTELAISLPPGMRFGLFGDPGKQVIGTPGAEPYPTPSHYP